MGGDHPSPDIVNKLLSGLAPVKLLVIVGIYARLQPLWLGSSRAIFLRELHLNARLSGRSFSFFYLLIIMGSNCGGLEYISWCCFCSYCRFCCKKFMYYTVCRPISCYHFFFFFKQRRAEYVGLLIN